MGQKLSSIHFVPSDKHYADVVHIVRWAIDHATATDPTILHAATPYCARLKTADALSIAQSLSQNDFFSTVNADSTAGGDVFARSFIAGLRRAAKLDDGPVSRPHFGTSPGAGRLGTTAPRSSVKSAGKSAAKARQIEEDDGLLAEIVGSSKSKQRAVHTDGWRTRGTPVAQPSATPKSKGNTQQQTQQSTGAESGISTLLQDIEGDTFIATQEWA